MNISSRFIAAPVIKEVALALRYGMFGWKWGGECVIPLHNLLGREIEGKGLDTALYFH